jgi:hypothetical protein
MWDVPPLTWARREWRALLRPYRIAPQASEHNDLACRLLAFANSLRRAEKAS